MKKRICLIVAVLVVVLFCWIHHQQQGYQDLQGTYTCLEADNRYIFSFYEDEYDLYDTTSLMAHGDYEQHDDYGVLKGSECCDYLVLVSQEKFVYQIAKDDLVCHFQKTSDTAICYR